PARLELGYFITVTRLKNGNPVGEPYRLAREILFQEGNGISVNVSPTSSGYLYILNDGPLPDGSQSINVLYPALNATAQIGSGQAVRIPQTKTKWFELDQASGTEK